MTKTEKDGTLVADFVNTSLNVRLSEKLQTTLGQDGVNAYAVYYDANGNNPTWTTLVDNGSITSNVEIKGQAIVGLNTIPLTQTVDGAFEGMSGGKVYFLVQSQSDSNKTDLKSVLTTESTINWVSSDQYDYRYDSFEVTLENSPFDQGNLTSVNGFGLPMKLEVTYNDGKTPATVGYKVPGNTMFKDFDDASAGSAVKFSEGPLKDVYRAGIAPVIALSNDLGHYSADDWNAYLDKVKAPASDIVIAGYFNGAPDANKIWHDGAFYSYQLSWDSSDGGRFWLDPTGTSQVRGRIQFTEADLANSIYSTLGNVGIYEEGSDTPYQIFGHNPSKPLYNSDTELASMNSGENNQWGAVIAQFLTGFTGGYYNSVGKSLNDDNSDAIDLNQNINWDPTYAFGAHLSSGAPDGFDPYSKVFYETSNSYGSGYTDNLMREYNQGSPLVSVSNANGSNVNELSITIFDDTETPDGYVEPLIYNYIAPGDKGYTEAKAGTNTSGNSVGLSLFNADMIVKEDTPITIEIYTDKADSKGSHWQSVTIQTDAKSKDANYHTLWQNWGFQIDTDGTYKIVPSGIVTTAGNLLLTQFPGNEEGVHWSRITIGSDDAAKTFNLYTNVQSDGMFLNPAVQGDQIGLAVDGLALLTPQQSTAETVPTFNVGFLYSATSVLPSDMLEYNYAESQATDFPTPAAPVAGTLDGDKFGALSGQDTTMTATKATSKSSEIAFGWTGDNADAPTDWLAHYTNKVNPLNYAQVSVSSGSGQAITPLLTNGDLDGMWTTRAATLGNGTYTVTMKEYLASDTTQKTLVGKESSALTLTVDVAELGLGRAHGGQSLRLDNSADMAGDVDGNWVKLSVTDSPAAAGAAVAVVLLNKSGERVDPHTGETGVSVSDATLTTMGGVSFQDGSLKGTQTVYLPENLRLGFVALNATDWDDTSGVATVSVGPKGGAEVTVGGHVLTAEVDNTLSAAALLADAQRATGEALVYLSHGTQVMVDMAGDAETGNRMGFVRVEVDTADDTWTVDGVAEGEAGFKAAVRAQMDAEFSLRGKGQFEKDGVWTVAGDTGFYAPVLINSAGEVLFAPAENGDEGDGDALRVMGENFFTFEDGTGSRDYDDMTVRLTPVTASDDGRLDGTTYVPLVLEEKAVVRAGDKFVSYTPDDGGPGHGLTLLATADDPAHLKIKGTAIFHGAGGVEVEGGGVKVVVGEDGRLVLRSDGDGDVLDMARGSGPATILNDGLISGNISLRDGDDVVRGPGEFDGHVSMGRGSDLFAGGAGQDSVHGGRGMDLLKGGAGEDSLRGGRGDDVLRGGNGNDTVTGGRGKDKLYGGQDDDILHGGRGADRLQGGLGEDSLQGGRGNDVLLGGAGDDVFVMQLQNGNDRIRDYHIGEDIVDLRAFDLAPDVADAMIAAAMGEAPNGTLRLDLEDLGGAGSVRFTGLDGTEAADITFLL
ncbi:hypothetical protein [Chachezhania sediminis]|uniref:hypothetical protein n=1 Tax=Chachezhania sediminis TaxID=2599291 RepID=UPI00131C4C8A|nr:hypothetical protein [Chachezhania sediminis]